MGKHIKSNGNGCIVVSKSAMTVIAILIAVCSAIFPAIYVYGALNERVDMVVAREEQNRDQWSVMVNEIQDMKLQVVRNQVSLETIKEDTTIIKQKLDRNIDSIVDLQK